MAFATGEANVPPGDVTGFQSMGVAFTSLSLVPCPSDSWKLTGNSSSLCVVQV